MGGLKPEFISACNATSPLDVQNPTLGHGVSANGFGVTGIIRTAGLGSY